MHRFSLTFFLLALLVTFCGGTASALDYPVGPRAGYTSWNGIHQMHFGGHARLGEIFPNMDLTPGVEMGFSDGFTVITINGDLTYRFTELTSPPWGLYAGGSLSLNYLDSDLMNGNLDLGLSALVGSTRRLDNGHEVLGEVRLGLLDSPGFKLTFGYTFF